ncbi:muscarinic acetylcholine receptor M1-like [Scleropages formosus]|uniref:muscarinic acetylcholine receptor M1-like n=1 Tax=Scleropages formosus TaxID=113540 RepID=UPI0008780FBC|nr:muscarinic acetylcholine receptor M1-like [Scleropages formosus]
MNITSIHSNFSQDHNITTDPLGSHAIWEVVVIILITGPLSLITIIGNLLVIIAFRLNGHLRTVSNYFLLSLAVADVILGAISMNLYTTYIIMGRWTLGNLACDIWLAIDYVTSNASVMNLLIISFDRFFSVTRPLTYRVKRTPRRAAIMISLAWTISFVLWAPAILFWQYVVGKRTVPKNQCFIQFLSEPTITFGTAIAAFYLPVTIMIILYWRIYRETENRSQQLAGLVGTPDYRGTSSRSRHQETHSSSTKSSSSSSADTQGEESQNREVQSSCFPRQNTTRLLTGKGSEITSPSLGRRAYLKANSNGSWNVDDEDVSSCSSSGEEDAARKDKGSAVVHVPLIEMGNKSRGQTQRYETCAVPRVQESGAQRLGSQSSLDQAKPSSLTWPKSKKSRNTSLIREKKAARTLSAILLAFILTWTPYNIMVLVSTFCDLCVPGKLWQLGYWLCYVNSTVNPMCYALCNKSFRVTFKMLLLCRWDKRKWAKPHLSAPSHLRPHNSSSVA